MTMMRSESIEIRRTIRWHWLTLSVITTSFLFLVMGGPAFAQGNRSPSPTPARGDKKMPLNVSGVYKVEEIRFDPMAVGRNKVTIKLRNLSGQSQRAGIRIQTQTRRAGWGSSHFGCDLAPRQEKWYSFHFTVRDEFIDKTWIGLRFSNPPLEGGYRDIRFYGSELERREPDVDIFLPVNPELAADITSRFLEFQDMLGHARYDDVWNAVTVPFQQAEFLGAKRNVEWILNRHKPSRKDQYLKLKPKEVAKNGPLTILFAALNSAEWKIPFVKEKGQWKMDGIEGYVRPSRKGNLLATMRKRTARHFDVYYMKNSTAERDIEKIVEERDTGYDEICKFLGLTSDKRITLVFFEDMQSKRSETGHQGAGLARGTMIVEVYNQTMYLDPFHETTHILAKSIGRPPAIFNEGLATYMSERLGSPALREFGGGESSLYERVRELRGKGDWIPLGELLSYTEIGPGWSRPRIAYPEAGAFVKFLVDTYGKDKFLHAYQSLTNSKTRSVLKQNEGKLENIYGFSQADLERQWIETIEAQNTL